MFADRVLSGMRPTGVCTSAIYHGALKNWLRLQEEYECLYFAADWHALTTHYETPERIEDSVWEMFIDWLAVGINPTPVDDIHPVARGRACGADLLLGMIAPVGWLERVPTYKDQQQKARRPRPDDIRLSRLSGNAGSGHPDLPGQYGAGR